MFIYINREQGAAVVADEAILSGQLVVVTPKADGKLHIKKVNGAGDLAKSLAVAYLDHAKVVNRRRTDVNASLTSNEHEQIASGKEAGALYGRLRGMTNQLNDGLYTPGQKLTIDTTTARLKAWASGDPVYGRVSLEAEPTRVTGQNNMLPVTLSLPEVL